MKPNRERIEQIRDLALVQKVEGMLIQEWELVALCNASLALIELTLAVGDHSDAMTTDGELHKPFITACEAFLSTQSGDEERQ